MGFDVLLDQYIPIKYQTPERRTICPVCCYPLEDTERGLHCKFCSWVEGIPPKYIPRVPENP